MNSPYARLKEKALQNERLTPDEALSIVQSSEADVMSVVDAAYAARRRFFGKRVKLNYLVNVKSGLCPEDCHYCTQSKISEAPIEKYPLMSVEEMAANLERGIAVGAKRACLVASGRGPSPRELNAFCDSVKALKDKHPQMEVCACLGLLMEGQAKQLKDAGVFAYNHNINTSKSHYEKICGTHTYDDRLDTVEKVKESGMSSCSGVLMGMGETDADVLEMAFTLRDAQAESIPVNFLVSVPKTPMAGINHLSPLRALRILSLFRLTNPTAELRVAGGREVHLRHLQPLALLVANSIFVGDYLTTQGQSPYADLEMIRDLGFEVEGQAPDFLDSVLGQPRSDANLKCTSC